MTTVTINSIKVKPADRLFDCLLCLILPPISCIDLIQDITQPEITAPLLTTKFLLDKCCSIIGVEFPQSNHQAFRSSPYKDRLSTIAIKLIKKQFTQLAQMPFFRVEGIFLTVVLSKYKQA